MEDMDFGRCYAIEFDNGTVKLGKTTAIVKRLNKHKSDAGKFGVSIVSMIFTDVIPMHSDMERKILSDACSICSPTKSNEYFNGINIYDCMGFFHSYGVNYMRTSSIPKIDNNNSLLVSVDLLPDCNLYDAGFDFIDTGSDANDERSVGEITRDRIINSIVVSGIELAPSVIVQRCTSKRLGIDKQQVLSSIKEMCDEGIILPIKMKHAKTGFESERYAVKKG